MNETMQKNHIIELSQLRANGTTAMAESTMIVPITKLNDQDQLNAERNTLFRKYPLIVGTESMIPNVGDYFTEEISGLPVLIVRARDNVVRAFINVCKHRGQRLCADRFGNKKSFVCPFHAWTYDTTGKCLTFVDRRGFDGLDPEDYSLTPLPTNVSYGFIWVTPTEDISEAIPFDQFIPEALGEELRQFESHTQFVYKTETTERKFNWKLGVDTFQEVFHFAFLHKNTLGNSVISNFTAFAAFGKHHRITVVHSDFPELLLKADEDQDLFNHAALVYTIFPNTVLVWQLDHWEAWSFFPANDSNSECIVKITMLLDREPDSERLSRRWLKNWELTRKTVYTEDFDMAAVIQSNISQGIPQHLVYGRNEIALQNFHKNIEDALTHSRS